MINLILKHYDKKDIELLNTLSYNMISSVDTDKIAKTPKITETELFYPVNGYKFLHEAAIIEFGGRLFASWYSCPETELCGTSEIRERRSLDCGRSWTEPDTVCKDDSGKILYCPPVYHIEDGKLYMLINEMVSADMMHAMDLFVLDEETDKFRLVWSKPIPFKLNTNVYRLDNGKLFMPGRIAKLDQFPNTPAVIIVDSGRIDSDYRVVKLQDNGFISTEIEYVHPEMTALTDGAKITIYCRNDKSNVPIMYISQDYGETWSKPIAHNIPFSNSKIYSGTLSNGRKYIIGNIYPERSKLAILFAEPDADIFTVGYTLQDGRSDTLGYGGEQWSYPVAYEYEGNLYVIYSAVSEDGRGAAMSVIPIDI